MTSTYEKRLITFKKWFHIISTSEILVVAEFCFELNIKNFITCSKCDLTLNNWKFKRDFMKTHTRQSSNCSFVQDLNENETSSSTRAKSASINDIAFSSQTFYLIMKDLYHKQQTLLAKVEKDLAVIETEKTAIVVQEIAESKIDVVVNSELKTKIKSFKFEKFTISSSSTSTESSLEFATQSNVIFAASSVFISVSKSSKLNSSRSISFCSTSTILLISQSNRSFVLNIMLFVSYDKRLTTFKNWFHDKLSAIDTTAIEFRHKSNTTNIIYSDIIICSECDAIWFEWLNDKNSLQIHLMWNDCLLTKTLNEKLEAVISTSSSLFIQSKFQLVASSEFQAKLKTFKFEKFAISSDFNSTSIKSIFESIIKSNVVFAASSISISICMSILNIEKLETEKAFIVAQEIMKQEIVVVVIEAIESKICVKNINFFDSTMQIDFWNEFRISVFSASFLQHLIEIAVNYREKSVIKILFQCFRDSALQWLKNQLKFISLNDFKIVMTKIFSELVANLDSIIIDSSSQKYHRCFECDVQFSSTSRLLAHTQKNCSKSFTCKHCEKVMISNNKLHKHVRLHHIKKSYSNKTLKQRFVERKNNHINSSISSFISSTTFKSMTTSAKSLYLFISMTKAQVARFIEFSIDSSITSMNSIASIEFFYFITFSITSESTSTILKFSHHSITMMKTSVVCSSTFHITSSLTSSRISILSHILSKIYMTMNDLFEMFAEISSNKNTNIIQKKSISSCFSEFRQSHHSVDQSNLKNSNSINSHRFHSVIYSKLIRDHKFFTNIASLIKSTSTTTKSSQHSIYMQKTLVICSFTSSSTSSRSLTLSHAASKIYMIMKKLFEMFAEKTRKKNKNIIQKKSIFSCFSESRQTRIKSLCPQENLKNSIKIAKKQFRKKWNIIHKRVRSSMSDQIKIINYFKSADQSNSTSIKSIKFNTFISCLNSTSRVCYSVNQNAKISHIALETNFTSLIKSRIKIRASIDSSKSRYLVAADVDHSIKDIRVETSLTDAKKYNSIKSSIKSSIKRFKSLKFVVFINSLNSTFRFSLSVNHDSVMSQMLISISSRIDFLRALINQMIYVSINSRFRRFRQRYIAVVVVLICF